MGRNMLYCVLGQEEEDIVLWGEEEEEEEDAGDGGLQGNAERSASWRAGRVVRTCVDSKTIKETPLLPPKKPRDPSAADA